MKSDAAINELFGVACCRYAALSIASACVFGSTARNEARHDSVIDGFIDVAPGRKCSLINLVCLRRFLEAELGVSVDLTTHASLDPQLLSNIEREAVEAFRCLVASISFSRNCRFGSEAVRHVPDEVLNTRPEIPWADITAIGSVNRREYRRVDPATIWSLAADDLPSLKAAIIAVVRK